MQATLSPRNKLADAIAPRPRVEPIVDDRASRRDVFANHLLDARDRTAWNTRDAQAESAAPSKKIESTRSRDDAAERRDSAASDTTDRASASSAKAAKKSKQADADSEADTDEHSDAENSAKPAAASATATDPTAEALAAAANAAASQPAVATNKNEVAQSQSSGDENHAVELAAAVALATQVTPTDGVAPDAEATDASTETASPDALAAVNLKVVDPDAKPAKADPNAAKTAQQADAAVPEAAAKSQEHGSRDPDAQQQPNQEDASASANAADLPEAAEPHKHKASAESTFDALLAKLTPQDAGQTKPAADRPLITPTSTVPPEQKFAADNVDNVVKSVRTQVAGGGGEMRMRLDPPELGALDVAVKMLDGRMTASFTTSNDQATQLLSHSLNQLKQSLEASGITVDRIQVRQSGNDNNAQQQPGEHGRDGQSGAFEQSPGRGDQQRKDAVQKMWRKLAYGSDELDFVA